MPGDVWVRHLLPEEELGRKLLQAHVGGRLAVLAGDSAVVDAGVQRGVGARALSDGEGELRGEGLLVRGLSRDRVRDAAALLFWAAWVKLVSVQWSWKADGRSLRQEGSLGDV